MSQPIAAEYNSTPAAVGTGQKVNLQADSYGRLQTAAPDDVATQSLASVTMTGSSMSVVAASATRVMVKIFAADTNVGTIYLDETGGTVTSPIGTQLLGGGGILITGKAAQSAMTAIGTSGDKLAVYTG